ncbi:MAG: winged helix-turn-helix transcriptional regulator [Thermoplasmatota archaeon]
MTGRGGGVGPALRRALGEEPPRRDFSVGRSSVLMSPMRLRIFQELCNHPCARVREVSRAVGVAAPAVLWHLERLVRAGIVRRLRVGGRSAYFPAQALEDEDIGFLAALSDAKSAGAARIILDSPGMTQRELRAAARCSGHTLRALAARGVVECLREGRNRRYYPAAALRQRREAFERRSRRFKQLLISLLSREGLSPEVCGWGPHSIEIRVRTGASVQTLRFLRNPYYLEGREG